MLIKKKITKFEGAFVVFKVPSIECLGYISILYLVICLYIHKLPFIKRDVVIDLQYLIAS